MMTKTLEDTELLAIQEDIYRIENERDDLLAQANAASCKEDQISLNAALNMKENELRARSSDVSFYLNRLK